MLDSEMIEEDDLSPEMREIADVLGMEAALELCEIFGGTRVWVQSPASLRKAQAHAMIERGRSPREAARASGLSAAQLEREEA